MMPQNSLPFQYIADKNENNLTSFAGLPLYMELAQVSGLSTAIRDCLTTKTQGWSDQHIILSLILLNLAGGDCVEDIERLADDAGLSTLLTKAETHGMKRKERRVYERRFRKEKIRSFPSQSVIRRHLESFHATNEENKRVKGSAFIPAPNEALQGLMQVNATLAAFAQKKNPCTTATLDQDATLAETHKRTALYCYEKFKAYQPFNTYWAEQKLLVHSEFRDGNVPAGFEQLRLLQASLDTLPDGIEHVFLRSDTAGYQQALLEYCAEGKNKGFGRIEFAISAKVTKGFKQAVSDVKELDWKPIYKEDAKGKRVESGQEYAEVCFVPAWTCTAKNKPDYRYLAIREALEDQQTIQGLETTPLPVQQELPFQTIHLSKRCYKLFGVVTNRKIDGEALIHWHRERCGTSEKVHHVEKNELAGGQFPSQKFGANAAWWQIMVLAFNLNVLMKMFALPETLKTKGLKKLRLYVIGVAGKVIQHARGLLIKLSGGQATIDLLTMIRTRIAALGIPPPIIGSS
jgi:hypothetical protein